MMAGSPVSLLRATVAVGTARLAPGHGHLAVRFLRNVEREQADGAEVRSRGARSSLNHRDRATVGSRNRLVDCQVFVAGNNRFDQPRISRMCTAMLLRVACGNGLPGGSMG